MKRILFLVCLALFFIAGCSHNEAGLAVPTVEKKPEIDWKSLSKDRFKIAKAQGKCLFILFNLRSCKACVHFNKNALADKKVIDLINEKFVPILVDDFNPRLFDIAEVSRVKMFPTFIVFDTVKQDELLRGGPMKDTHLIAVLNLAMAMNRLIVLNDNLNKNQPNWENLGSSDKL